MSEGSGERPGRKIISINEARRRREVQEDIPGECDELAKQIKEEYESENLRLGGNMVQLSRTEREAAGYPLRVLGKKLKDDKNGQDPLGQHLRYFVAMEYLRKRGLLQE